MMMQQREGSKDQLKVAIITSLTGGLGHYAAHLSEPLSKLCTPKFITYPQLDLSGTVVKQITDSFIRKYVKWPRFDIDEDNSLSITTIMDYLNSKDINIINIHIATTVKRKITYFTTLIDYGKRLYNKKFVFTLHDVLPFDEDKRMMKLLKMFYMMADHFTVGNDTEKQKLMKHFEIPDHKITVIPHGIYNLFDRHLYTQQFARSYLGIPKEKKVILFFGYLRQYKGFEYLIKAAKTLTKKDPDIMIYVASGLKFAPKDLVENSLTQIQKLDLQEKFALNLNYLDTLDLEAVFKACDVVALPYTHASQSGVMMMAFGFKKPVVLTDVFDDKKWVDGKAGLVAKSEDAVSLAEQLDKLIHSPELAQSMGEYGFTHASTSFDWKHIAEKYFEVYQKLL